MKTLEELLSGGTLAEIIAKQAENTKQAAAIFDKKDATADEIKSAVALDDETEKLNVKRTELEAVESAKNRTKSRMALINDPQRPVTSKGNGGLEKDSLPAHIATATVKNFSGATPQEAALKAYRAGQWLLATQFGNQKAALYCKDHGIEIKAAQAEDVNETGGAVVFPEFEATLIDLREQYGVFRPNCRAVPMGSDTKTIPRRTGGVTAYFVGEGAAITTSNKTFDNVTLVAKKVAALVPYSTEISEDAAINLADDLAREIAYAFALKEDQCGFNGDATSTYGGMTGVITKLLGLSGTIGNISGLLVGAGNAYSELTLANFNGVVGLLPQYADTPNAKWYMHKSFYHAVAERLAMAAGGTTAREVAGGLPRTTFLGYPVVFTQVLPKIEANSQVCALFGDLGLAAKFGDRRMTTLFTDPYSLSANDQVQIRGTERFDIVVHDVGNATATAADKVPGPIVGLITAAA